MERFIKAQNKVYDTVIKELKDEYKETHWMWYIFPQIIGLGRSDIAVYYSIKSLDEFNSYINNKTLISRYIECCNILLDSSTIYPEDIFGDIDAMKLKSSLTLFYLLDKKNEALYKKLIDKFYDGELDEKTIKIINNMKENNNEK